MDFQGRLNQANGRLKAYKVGVRIEIHGNRLYLRATFPPKPGSRKVHPYQQRLALGFHANPTGISKAEIQARKVGALLDCNEFFWEPYLKEVVSPPETVGEWISKFEQNYFERRRRNPKSETTWSTDYWAVLKHLPSDQALTPELLSKSILDTIPDTKTRKRFCMVAQALAKFAGLDIDTKPFSGTYSARRVTPRDLPEDGVIAAWFERVRNPAWRWVFGVLATYGLRPHEIFYLDTRDLAAGGYILSVLDGKTGPRRVWPCYPEWVEQFELHAVNIPAVTGKSNSHLGARCWEAFNRIGLPFKPYDLRHCWAVRTLEFGLDVSLAAQQMGHTVKVHTDLYHHWISDRYHQRAFEALMMRSDRPKPPA